MTSPAKSSTSYRKRSCDRDSLIKSKHVDALARVERRVKTLDLHKHLLDALTWGRLFGGCLLWLGADDQQDTSQPLNEREIRSVTFAQIYDRRRALPIEWYDQGHEPKFGEPRVYEVVNYRTGMVSMLHESRVIRFGGAHTGDYERWRNLSWDYSVLQRPYEAIRQFSMTYKAAEIMMSDANQGVFRMRGLLSMIAQNQVQNVHTRLMLLDMARSVSRSVLLDAEGESFEKIATSFSGVAELLDRSAQRLSAATGIPVTILMGQSPAGLNATGASDIRIWYDTLKAWQKEHLLPRIEHCVRLIALGEGLSDFEFEIEFPSLWQETAAEKGQREKLEADTAAVWIQSEVLTPEEVAEARFSGAEAQPYRLYASRNLQAEPHPPGATEGAPQGDSPFLRDDEVGPRGGVYWITKSGAKRYGQPPGGAAAKGACSREGRCPCEGRGPREGRCCCPCEGRCVRPREAGEREAELRPGESLSGGARR